MRIELSKQECKWLADLVNKAKVMLIARRESGLDCSFWPDAQAVMDWWIYGRRNDGNDFGEVQLSL